MAADVRWVRVRGCAAAAMLLPPVEGPLLRDRCGRWTAGRDRTGQPVALPRDMANCVRDARRAAVDARRRNSRQDDATAAVDAAAAGPAVPAVAGRW